MRDIVYTYCRYIVLKVRYSVPIIIDHIAGGLQCTDMKAIVILSCTKGYKVQTVTMYRYEDHCNKRLYERVYTIYVQYRQ